MMLELRDINKTYLQGKLEVPVLNGISLSVEEGEYLAIMGPSGSGKTTLMNIIGCLDNPSSGEYILEGEDIAQVSEKRMSEVRLHSIGFVFQSFYLLSRQSAIDNVALPLLYAGVRRRERMEIARKALERVGLGDRVDFKPTQLSGGQCQRVAIARAIVNSPKILLADEPTGALDTKSGEQIMEIFRRLNEEGVTIVMITHEPEIAAHAKRTLHIRDGLLVDSAGRRPEKPAPAPTPVPSGPKPAPASAGAEPVRMPRPQPPIAPRTVGSAESRPAAPTGKPASQKPGAQANPPTEGRPPKNTGSRPGPRPAGTGQGKPAPQQGKKPDAEPAQLYSRLEPRQRPPREKQEPGRKPQPRRPENPQTPGGQARDGRPKAPRPQEQKLQEHKLQEQKTQEQKLQEGSLPKEKPLGKSQPYKPSKAQPAPEDQPLRGQNPPQGENAGEAGEDKSLNQPISGKSIIEALERQLKKLSEERDGTPENREESSDEQ